LLSLLLYITIIRKTAIYLTKKQPFIPPLKEYTFPAGSRKDIEQILGSLRKYPNAAVGVDAPLIITNESGHRPNEKEFLKHFAKFGLLYPVNRKNIVSFFLNCCTSV
ncbi:MAG: hypothetical protein PWQ90_219, partial [Pseudothermotoga sp.]|nr:hypothetical protein [Pseudothermotoga sp.]